MSRIKKFYLNELEEIRLSRLFLSILAIWLISGLALFFYPRRGEFGDMFGSINTLFSGLAFGGIIYTIFQQKIEIKLQRTDLDLQRIEVKKTNMELAKQVEALNIQRFENTFFNMLTLHHKLVDSLVFKHDRSTTVHSTGRLVFESIHYEMIRRKNTPFDTLLDEVISSRELSLAQYFNNLKEALNLVERTNFLQDVQKEMYINTLCAQLSPAEAVVIMYYILYWRDRENDYANLYKLAEGQAHFMPIEYLKVWIPWVSELKVKTAQGLQ